jgi:hypothetical protein
MAATVSADAPWHVGGMTLRTKYLRPTGVAHQQIVKTTGVSSGTVSVIRRDIKAQMPLMRVTGCVTVALLSKREG